MYGLHILAEVQIRNHSVYLISANDNRTRVSVANTHVDRSWYTRVGTVCEKKEEGRWGRRGGVGVGWWGGEEEGSRGRGVEGYWSVSANNDPF